MGSTTLLDIIGSTITFGYLLIAVLRLNASASENNYAYNQNYLLQRNMIVLTTMLENDLKHVGIDANKLNNGATTTSNGGVLSADTHDLLYESDLNLDGVMHRVEWWYDTTAAGVIPNVQNTRIHYLYRNVDGVQSKMNFGVTAFNLSYWSVYDDNIPVTLAAAPYYPLTNASVPDTGNIGPVSVTIRLESPYRMNEGYMSKNDTSEYQMVWRQIRSISRNNSIQFQ